MTCQLCKSGNNREATNHAYTFRHRKNLIQLFKEYNKKKENMPFDKWQEIYEECLTILTKIVGD